MEPWLESLGVTLLALAGVGLGVWFSRRRGRHWILGYFIPLALIVIYGVARQIPAFAFTPPVSWMMTGRTKFAIVGFICAMVLTTPLARLPRKRDRIGLSLLMAVMIFMWSVLPFLAPAFNRTYLAGLQTTIDRDGVCRQSNDYNCGPAAAVTALRKLGFPAEEGEIAVLARATAYTGTEPDFLAAALQRRYGKDGLASEFRLFNSIDELRQAGLTLAVIKFNFLTDHFVTVLEVGDRDVLVGDPLSGVARLSHEEFASRWRRSGIVLSRKPE